jgi:hypothetical protein
MQQNTAHINMVNRVAGIEDKLNAIKILEKNVLEMNQMWNHLSALIYV